MRAPNPPNPPTVPTPTRAQAQVRTPVPALLAALPMLLLLLLLLFLSLAACAPGAEEGEQPATEEETSLEQQEELETADDLAGEPYREQAAGAEGEEPLEAPGEGFADESAIDPEAEEDGIGAGAAEEPEVAPTPTEAPEEAAPPVTASNEGRQVFVAQGCGTCHSVSTAGIEAKVSSDSRTFGGDLAGTGLGREELRAIAMQETEVDGRKHPKRFGGTDEELAVLIDWLLAQE